MVLTGYDENVFNSRPGLQVSKTMFDDKVGQGEEAFEYVAYCIFPEMKEVERARLAHCSEMSLEGFLPLYLQALRMAILKRVHSKIAGYLWHAGSFNLLHMDCSLKGDGADALPGLRGRTFFGDNFEDEWFIVALLFEISKAFPTLLITVWDGEGQFLLIEAAEYLPDWLEPEASANRLFIYQGKLCLINRELSRRPTLKEASRLVRERPEEVLASSAIQKAIQDRIERYQKNISQDLHCAKVILPNILACLLKGHPQMICPLVRHFYYRKPVDLVRCRDLPTFREALQTVPTLVTFTRMQFAQLACQRLKIPEVYQIPEGIGEAERVAMELGYKLSLGAELALLSPNLAEERVDNEDVTLWAKRLFDEECPPREEGKATMEGRLNDLLKQFEGAPLLKPYFGPEDNLSWMCVDEVQVERQIQDALQHSLGQLSIAKDSDEGEESFGKLEDDQGDINIDNNRQFAEEASKLKSTLDRFKFFMNAESDYQGINFDEENSSSSDSSEGENDAFLEYEVLETIHHDPDLLMKILEYNAHHGMDSSDLLHKLKVMAQQPSKAKSSSWPQKGLCDIDPQKLAKAQTPSQRTIALEKEACKELVSSGESDDTDNDMPLKAYMTAMDREIAEGDPERTVKMTQIVADHSLAELIIKTDEMEAGPSRTIIGSLSR